MALKFELDTLDGLEDDVKSLYEKKGDKYRLIVEGVPSGEGPSQEDLDRVQLALDEERRQRREAEKQRKAWEKLGKTPDEIAELLDAQETAKTQKLKDEGEFEKLLGQHKAKWETEKSGLVSRAEAAETALRKYVGESAFVSELAKLGATEEGVALLPLRYAGRIRVDIDGGSPVVEVLAEDGETLMAGTGKGGRASLGDLVEEATKKFPSLFKSKGKGGSETTPGGKRGDGRSSKKFNEMSGEELSTLRRQNPEEYDRLKREYYEGQAA